MLFCCDAAFLEASCPFFGQMQTFDNVTSIQEYIVAGWGCNFSVCAMYANSSFCDGRNCTAAFL